MTPEPGHRELGPGLVEHLDDTGGDVFGLHRLLGASGVVPEINSVLVKVGSTAVTLTPCGAYSSASAVAKPTTANLVPA